MNLSILEYMVKATLLAFNLELLHLELFFHTWMLMKKIKYDLLEFLGDSGWCFPHISKNPLREIVLCAITNNF